MLDVIFTNMEHLNDYVVLDYQVFSLVSIFHINCMKMSFHGNQMGDILGILLLKTFY